MPQSPRANMAGIFFCDQLWFNTSPLDRKLLFDYFASLTLRFVLWRRAASISIRPDPRPSLTFEDDGYGVRAERGDGAAPVLDPEAEEELAGEDHSHIRTLHPWRAHLPGAAAC